MGLQDCLYMGNIDSLRDWGHARDYVEAQWLMLQQDTPRDFVIATGEQYSVRDLINRAAHNLGLEFSWSGDGESELATVVSVADSECKIKPGCTVVRIDPRYYRPTEVDSLLGDPSRARDLLGWAPRTSFDELVKEMVEVDLELARRDAFVSSAGYTAYTFNE